MPAEALTTYASTRWIRDEYPCLDIDCFFDDTLAWTWTLRSPQTVFDALSLRVYEGKDFLDVALDCAKKGMFFDDLKPSGFAEYGKQIFPELPAFYDSQASDECLQLLEKAAQTLDANDLGLLNRRYPGTIYSNERILHELARRTAAAASCSEESKALKEREEALRWLEEVCLPTKPKSESVIEHMSTPHYLLFTRVYFDVVKLQAMGRDLQMGKGDPVKAEEKFKAIFPRIRLSSRDLQRLVAQDRRDSPTLMAADLFGARLGSRERTVRKWLKSALWQKKWDEDNPRIRRIAKIVAGDIIKQHRAGTWKMPQQVVSELSREELIALVKRHPADTQATSAG